MSELVRDVVGVFGQLKAWSQASQIIASANVWMQLPPESTHYRYLHLHDAGTAVHALAGDPVYI